MVQTTKWMQATNEVIEDLNQEIDGLEARLERAKTKVQEAIAKENWMQVPELSLKVTELIAQLTPLRTYRDRLEEGRELEPMAAHAAYSALSHEPSHSSSAIARILDEQELLAKQLAAKCLMQI